LLAAFAAVLRLFKYDIVLSYAKTTARVFATQTIVCIFLLFPAIFVPPWFNFNRPLLKHVKIVARKKVIPQKPEIFRAKKKEKPVFIGFFL
jgi:hypothetical protein